jgi:hypothetical protein
VHFAHLARRKDAVVHHDEHTLAARVRAGSHAHGGDQVRRSVPARIGDCPHRAHQHDGLVGEEQQVEQVGRLLDRVGAMRDDQAVDVGPLEPRGRPAGQPPHLPGRDVRSRQPREVLDFDLGQVVEARHLRQDVLGALRASCAVRGAPRWRAVADGGRRRVTRCASERSRAGGRPPIAIARQRRTREISQGHRDT